MSKQISQSTITTALKNVIDPELGYNLIDLGLIYKIEINEPPTPSNPSNRPLANEPPVLITMTLTTPGCPLAPVFIDQVKQAVSAATNLNPDQVVVDLVFDPPWTPTLASEAIRFDLGY